MNMIKINRIRFKNYLYLGFEINQYIELIDFFHLIILFKKDYD